MKKITLIMVSLFVVASFAQIIPDLKSYTPTSDYENIHVQKIADDRYQSSFIIWVKKEVPLHKHADHTENIYVLEGKGQFTLGDSVYKISAGDYFNIPKETPHGVIVTSKKPLKVLSIQSPQFDGTDRIPVLSP